MQAPYKVPMVLSHPSCITAGQDYTTLTPTFGDVEPRTLSMVALPYNVRYIVTMEETERCLGRPKWNSCPEQGLLADLWCRVCQEKWCWVCDEVHTA